MSQPGQAPPQPGAYPPQQYAAPYQGAAPGQQAPAAGYQPQPGWQGYPAAGQNAPAQPYPPAAYPSQGTQYAPGQQVASYPVAPAAQPYPPQGYQYPPGTQYAPGQQYAAAAVPPGQAPGPSMAPQQYGPPAGSLMGQAATTGYFFDNTGKYKLVMQGTFVAVEAAVTPQEGLKAEGGAMVSMSTNVDLVAKADGGIGAAFCRCCCAGESAFFTYFHLKEGTRGDVLLAPAVPGEIIMLHLQGGEEWRIQKGSFLAADETITVGTAVQSFAQGCCSGEGFFILKATGKGRLLLNSYGAIVRYDLQPGEVRKIDNGFLVAWQAHMNYTINLASKSIVASLLSGECIVTTFTGPGTIYVQTRSMTALALAVAPYIPVVQQNQDGGGGIDFSS